MFLVVLLLLLFTAAAPSSISNVRLLGSSSSSGVVTVKIEGTDYKLCNDDVTLREAQVICRSAGLKVSFPSKEYGVSLQQGESLWPGRLQCSGTESSLDECTLTRDEGTTCSSGDAASITCYARGVRLMGEEQHQGRPLVFYNFQWGEICNQQFDDDDATVLCRMLGYSEPARYLKSATTYADKGFVLTKLNCSGEETSVIQCSSVTSHQALDECSFADTVFINCKPPNNPIRLVSGSHSGSGKLEMMHGGVWGGVCSSFFFDTEIRVACRDLGFPTENGESRTAALQPDTKFVVTDISCEGEEKHILECQHSFDVEFCTRDENVYLDCAPPATTRSTTITTTTEQTERTTATTRKTTSRRGKVMAGGNSSTEGDKDVVVTPPSTTTERAATWSTKPPVETSVRRTHTIPPAAGSGSKATALLPNVALLVIVFIKHNA